MLRLVTTAGYISRKCVTIYHLFTNLLAFVTVLIEKIQKVSLHTAGLFTTRKRATLF